MENEWVAGIILMGIIIPVTGLIYLLTNVRKRVGVLKKKILEITEKLDGL